MGLLDSTIAKKAFNEIEELEDKSFAQIVCPLMIEIVAEVK
jgi:hypothetical protein